MKNISLILMVFAALYIGSTSTGCSDKPVTATPKTTDTTEDTTATVVYTNQLQIGVVLYQLQTSADFTTGQYETATNKTIIVVDGSDSKTGVANFIIKFKANQVGTYSIADKNLEFQCGRGEGIKREEFNSANSEMVVNVTEYGAIGGKIKGTFSGKSKNAKTGQSVDVLLGKFEVIRGQDI